MGKINEAFKDKVLDLSVNGIYVYDLLKGTNVYINQQYTNLTGYTIDDINDMPQQEFFSLFHSEDQEKVSVHMQEVIASAPGEVVEIEYRFKKANGEWMWCLSRDAVFERNEEEKATQFMGTFIDITDRKTARIELIEANEKLKHANKELEQFAYVASHDLQEPLNTINSFAALLRNEFKEELDETAFNYLTYLSSASKRMKDLVKGLLDYNHIGHKKEKTDVDCNETLRQVSADLAIIIAETKTIIEADHLPTLNGFDTELRLLFQNLIANAIKFRNNKTTCRIKISASRESGSWKFSFQDNGIGIAPEDYEKIFVIFERLHDRNDYDGTGIGLAHCRKIVELHQGKIWVDSELGNGSIFYFTIAD